MQKLLWVWATLIVTWPLAAQPQLPRRNFENARPPLRGGLNGPLPGIATMIPSQAGGEKGIAVRIITPKQPRYEAGAPVVVQVNGGLGADGSAGPAEYAGLGFVEIHFAFPGGRLGEATSGGTYDQRGPACHRALADVIRFATGRLADKQGRKLDEWVAGTKILKQNCGIVGSSNGGNACGLAMALHGTEFPDLAFYASMESPLGEGVVSAELGGFEAGTNPAYNPKTGVLDLSKLAWSDDLEPGLRRKGKNIFGQQLKGGLYFDMNGDGKFDALKDFAVNAITCDPGSGFKAWYSPRILKAAEKKSLFGRPRPAHVPTLAEATEFWRYRDAAESLPAAVKNCPEVAVIVYANKRDHVQAAPDHPHIIIQVEGYRQAGARFVRLNPDRAYAEKIVAAAGLPRGNGSAAFADADAGKVCSRENIAADLEPESVSLSLYMQAAVAELADRVQAKDWSKNLDAVLFPNAPWSVLSRPPLQRPIAK